MLRVVRVARASPCVHNARSMPLYRKSSLRTYAWLALALVMISGSARVYGAGPAHGLSRLPGRALTVGYLNSIRKGVGTTSQNIAALNYEAVDLIALAFTLLNADGSFDFTYGSSDVYRPYLITNAHARSCAVLMSVVGDFQTVTADPS